MVTEFSAETQEVVPIHQVALIVDFIEDHLQDGQVVSIETDSKSRKLLKREARRNKQTLAKKIYRFMVGVDSYLQTHGVIEGVLESSALASAKESIYGAAVLIHADLQLTDYSKRATAVFTAIGSGPLASRLSGARATSSGKLKT